MTTSGMKWGDIVEAEHEQERRKQSNTGLHDGMMIVNGKEASNLPTEFDQLNLRQDLLEGVYLKGFDKPSMIQAVSIPLMLEEPPKNFIGQAQSGTGKTAAFCLGMLARVDPSMKRPQAICVCPTRELAVQNFQVLEELAAKTSVKAMLLVPDPDRSIVTGKEYSASHTGKYQHQIFVGTPGKIFGALKKKQLAPDAVRMFVLDEADEMLNGQNLMTQTRNILKFFTKAKPQIVCFSATYSDSVNKFVDKVVPKPRTTARLKREDVTIDNVEQYWIDCKSEDGKFSVLSDVYGLLSVGLSIIFTAKRTTAAQIADRMVQEGHSVKLLTGALEKSERDKVIASFRKSDFRALITTNVLARGIDIPAVTLVVNYDLPYMGNEQQQIDYENYVHRIGRAGRWKRRGVAINFVHDGRSQSTVESIQDFYQREIKELTIDGLIELGEKLDEMEADLKSFTEVAEEDPQLFDALAEQVDSDTKNDEDPSAAKLSSAPPEAAAVLSQADAAASARRAAADKAAALSETTPKASATVTSANEAHAAASAASAAESVLAALSATRN